MAEGNSKVHQGVFEVSYLSQVVQDKKYLKQEKFSVSKIKSQ